MLLQPIVVLGVKNANLYTVKLVYYHVCTIVYTNLLYFGLIIYRHKKHNLWRAGGHDRVFVSMVVAPLNHVKSQGVLKSLWIHAQVQAVL